MAGKEYAIVILSSSPPASDVYASASAQHAPSAQRAATLPSSPIAFSPLSSPMKTTCGALASGSRAVPIPQTALRGFATVGNLVRSEHLTNLDDKYAEILPEERHKGSVDDFEELKAVTKQPRKRATKKVTADNAEKPPPKPRARKPIADKDGAALEAEIRPSRVTKSPYLVDAGVDMVSKPQDAPAEAAHKFTKAGKPRKPRAKKENPDGDAEPKAKRVRVVKPKTAKPTKAALQEDLASDNHVTVQKLKTADLDTVMNAEQEHQSIWNLPYSPSKSIEAPSKRRSPDLSVDVLDLEPAVTRRRNWTPPRDSVAQVALARSAGKENNGSLLDNTNTTFTHVISNFTYESPSARPAGTIVKSGPINKGVTKRRRVELLDLPGNQANTRASSPEKGKAPKKKPRTITDLVTGQYAPKDPVPGPDAVTNELSEAQNSAAKAPVRDAAANVPSKKAPRKRSNPKTDAEKAESKAKAIPRARKATTKTAAKPKPIIEKLLSPKSAALRLQQQDILFGTSSQLALQEPPAMVRQLQHAIRESERDVELQPDIYMASTPRWPKLGKAHGTRSLWDASNRDEGGGLLEDSENVYSPEPDRTQDTPLLMSATRDLSDPHSDFVDIDDIELLPITKSSTLPTHGPLSQPVLVEPPAIRHNAVHESSFHDIDDFDCEPPPSNQNAESQDSFFDIDDFEMPESVQKFGSPLRKSGKMVSPATGKAKPRKGRSVPPSTEPAISVKRKGQAAAPKPSLLSQEQENLSIPPSTPPRSTGRFMDIDEILDSEEENLELLSPTPPRVRKLQNSPALPLTSNYESTVGACTEQNMAQVFRISTTQLEWVNIKPVIFTSITTHIRSIPPTPDPKNPSWHEKILMYDPIILEDFTAYLNDTAHIRTYRRATQKQIKAWNKELKMKGSAILGVENDDEVLVTGKELELYMVRDWCQEMSICCVHAKESRGRGTARKGFY